MIIYVVHKRYIDLDNNTGQKICVLYTHKVFKAHIR